MKYYVTADTALAAYLYLCGMKFVEATIWHDDSRRKHFVIIDEPRRPELEEQFFLRTTAVSPLDYHDARIAVSRFLRRETTYPQLPSL